MRNKPNQIVINRYISGEEIGSRSRCAPIFDNDIATISLGSKYTMSFRHHRSHNDYDRNVKEDVRLPVGSLLVFGDDARYKLSHEINKRKTDTVGCGNKRIPRGTRISITFRTVREEYKG